MGRGGCQVEGGGGVEKVWWHGRNLYNQTEKYGERGVSG